MHRSRILSVSLALLAVPCLTALAGSAAASAAPAVASPPPAQKGGAPAGPGWQCRTGTAPVTDNLTSSGTVCGRFDGTAWRGRAVITLTARGSTVRGLLGFGAYRMPASPAGISNTPFTVRPGRSVTITVTRTESLSSDDTGVTFRAGPYVSPAPGSGFSLAGSLSSPVIARHNRTVQNLDDTPTSPWACTARDLDGVQATGQATLCVRQAGGYVESKGSLTYTMRYDASLSTNLLVDDAQSAGTQQILRAAQRPTTVALPTTRVRLLTRDDAARTEVTIVQNASRPISTQRSETIALG